MSISHLPGFDPIAYANAKPFPHAVFDGAFDALFLMDVLDEFPRPGTEGWRIFAGEHEEMKHEGGPHLWGPNTKLLYKSLIGLRDDLSTLTGIPDLLGDHTGGGYHLVPPGGHLDMHVDFNFHPGVPHLQRRLNVLLYLNRDWNAGWGGNLVLADGATGNARNSKVITPEFNRLVVFTTTESSWHGHPIPLTPDAPLRCSFATYFYTEVHDPERVNEPHDTVWLDDHATEPQAVS